MVVPLRFYSEARGDPPLPAVDRDRCPIYVEDPELGCCEYCERPVASHSDRAIHGPHADPRPLLGQAEANEAVAPQVGTVPV